MSDNLPAEIVDTKELAQKAGITELQYKFLDALFGEADGDPVKAMELAGYKHRHTSLVLDSLTDEIKKRTEGYLAANSFKAAKSVVGLINDPEQPGGKLKLDASRDLLDRVGVKKTDASTGGTKIGLLILPAKRPVEDNPIAVDVEFERV